MLELERFAFGHLPACTHELHWSPGSGVFGPRSGVVGRQTISQVYCDPTIERIVRISQGTISATGRHTDRV